jgi:protease-4
VFSIGYDFDTTQLIFNLVEAVKNKEISAILLNIDNTGGSVEKYSAIHDLIKKIRVRKPVVGLITGAALSGGYMIASAVEYLIAQSASTIGSIGVVMELPKYKEPKMAGNVEAKLEIELFSQGQYKTIWNPYYTLTDSDRAYLKAEGQKAYDFFLKLVSENRNIDIKNAQEWADAKIHLASDALKLGLINEIGTIFEAEEKLLELIRKKNPTIVYDNDCQFIFNDQQQQQPK